MRTFLAAALLAFTAFTASAQKHVYEDLLVLFVDENYEKCLAKAENYTVNDDTRKDPLPYLYMSMSLYEMSKLEEFNEDYPKASRDALKYAEKYRKKDKEAEFFANYEDYWADLNVLAMGLAEIELSDEKWSRAKKYYDYMAGYYVENPGAWLMLANCQLKDNLAREAEETMKSFDAAMQANPDLSRLPEDQKKLLKFGMVTYADIMKEQGDRASAKSMMDKAKDLFADDEEFMMTYNDL